MARFLSIDTKWLEYLFVAIKPGLCKLNYAQIVGYGNIYQHAGVIRENLGIYPESTFFQVLSIDGEQTVTLQLVNLVNDNDIDFNLLVDSLQKYLNVIPNAGNPQLKTYQTVTNYR